MAPIQGRSGMNAGLAYIVKHIQKGLTLLTNMLPYYLFGNSPDDAYDYFDRAKATIESIRLWVHEE